LGPIVPRYIRPPRVRGEDYAEIGNLNDVFAFEEVILGKQIEHPYGIILNPAVKGIVPVEGSII
jgi:hypothetical protein